MDSSPRSSICSLLFIITSLWITLSLSYISSLLFALNHHCQRISPLWHDCRYTGTYICIYIYIYIIIFMDINPYSSLFITINQNQSLSITIFITLHHYQIDINPIVMYVRLPEANPTSKPDRSLLTPCRRPTWTSSGHRRRCRHLETSVLFFGGDLLGEALRNLAKQWIIVVNHDESWLIVSHVVDND